jgi:hypothetical protein
MADVVEGRDGRDLPKIGSPAQRALLAHGYKRLDQLTGVSEAEIARWHGVGRRRSACCAPPLRRGASRRAIASS